VHHFTLSLKAGTGAAHPSLNVNVTPPLSLAEQPDPLMEMQ
jgi:hypothetical protein